MSKFKIEIELDIDFQKFFNEITEGLYKDKTGSDESYEKGAVSKILHECYTNALESHLKWMSENHYEHAKHHLLIDEEIGKQISENFKITEYIKS